MARTQTNRGTPATWALQVAALSLSSEALGLLQGLSGWFHHWVPCFPCLSKMDRMAPTS